MNAYLTNSDEHQHQACPVALLQPEAVVPCPGSLAASPPAQPFCLLRLDLWPNAANSIVLLAQLKESIFPNHCMQSSTKVP